MSKRILIVDVPDDSDFDSFIDIKSRDGIFEIEHGKSIKVVEFIPPTHEKIRQMATDAVKTLRLKKIGDEASIIALFRNGLIDGADYILSLLK